MAIRLFYLYRICGQLLPIYPVYLLLFQQKGLSLAAISGLLIVWSLPGLVLEVPSSALADNWSRKKLLVIGRLLHGACFIVWSFAAGFSGFAIGFLLWGTGGACGSGTEEAWLYDYLKARGREAEFDRVWGESAFYYQFAVGLASVGGSILAAFSMPITLWLSAGLVLLSSVFAALLPEEGFQRLSSQSTAWRDYWHTLNESFRFCWAHAKVAVLIGFSVTVLVTAGILDEYDQLIVRSMGVPLALVGTWGLLRYSLEAFGSKLAWRLHGWVGNFLPVNPVALQITIGGLAGLILAAVAIFPVWYLLPLYGLFYFLLAGAKVLLTATIQGEVRDQGRATVQSLAAMLEIPAGLLIYALFGLVGGVDRLQGALMTVAVWMWLFCGLCWIIFQRCRK